MSKARPKFFDPKIFGFVIGGVVVGLVLLLYWNTTVFEWLELKYLDFLFVRETVSTETLQEGVDTVVSDPRVNPDIVISAIDYNSLSKFGRWPFPRYRHADLINSFSRVLDQDKRERALFLDVLFLEPDGKAIDDALVVESMKESGRVYLETALTVLENSASADPAMRERQIDLYEGLGTVKNLKGDWKAMTPFFGFEPPLSPYSRASKGYGHANYLSDRDSTYRRQPLVARSCFLLEEIRLDDLKPGYTVDESDFEWLGWRDWDKRMHPIPMPLTAESIESLKMTMEAQSPPRITDDNGDGIEEKSFVVWHYKDYFVPAITLTLALDYMNVKISDVEIVLGSTILIPNPQKFDPETGQWGPYTVLTKRAVVDDNGIIIIPEEFKTLDEIRIPIDGNAQMLINFVGGPSSESYEGVRNYPIRSFATYAERAPSPAQSSWPEDRNAANQIIMVGAFAKGVAQDEKNTPYGLMYGIEVHANALNTILNGNFLVYAPDWLNVTVLLVCCIVVVFLASRIPALYSSIVTLVFVIAIFVISMFVFEGQSVIFDFPTPSIAMLFTLLGVVGYRGMTDERDKKQIRETFGKYVSPTVVEQLVDNPPELGGVDKELTVLFSDIRGFTTLSENMSPQELVNHLNVYLTAMTDIILAYNGTLDKYVGDEVMCFWGAPIPMQDHAELACKCALRQMEKLAELNESWPESRRIRIGIGLNSGIMTVGNMGSPTRMNYTLMGDNVNLGARLEGTNKEYGTGIIVSEFTYGLVRDKFVFRELDNIRVKGKNKPVLMYELVDCIGPNEPPLPIGKTKGREGQ